MLRFGRIIPLILALLLLTPAVAQEPVAELIVVSADTATFPIITLQLSARDALGNGLTNLDGLQLTEGGRPVETFEIGTQSKGVDVIFVIDANDEIDGIDLIGDVSRLAKVRIAIANFANQQMSRADQDRISIIVPDDDGARYLIEDGTVPADVTDAIGAYTPEEFPESTPLQSMLQTALDQVATREPGGRYQAIVLFTDGGQLADQLDYDALMALAENSNAVIFAAILGGVASDNEVANVSGLTTPTGGSSVHMPRTDRLDPLFAAIASNRVVNTVRYRSRIAGDGDRTLDLALGAAAATYPVAVTVLPPVVDLSETDDLLVAGNGEVDTTEPTRITARVTWPDGFVRSLLSVKLFVDGVEQTVTRPPVLDPLGKLTLDWDATDIAPGSHTFAVELTDELGLSARSDSAERTVQIGPVVTAIPPTPTPEPVPTATPTPLEIGLAALQDNRTQSSIRIGMFIIAVLLLLIVLWRWRRRRVAADRGVTPSAPVVAETPPTAAPAAAATTTYVYFEPIRNADEYDGPIAITRELTTIGRDRHHASLVFDHETVGRYHARLLFSGGQFWIYDEGTPNGTVVNGQRIALEPQALQDGDLVQLGRVRLRFRIETRQDG